ncbi:hypothetical protein B9Z55_011151 [Caenorhabditis nigoni]|nr:hypothetical protein B9Z55_011151 [Caenorhabditis nigoni]
MAYSLLSKKAFSTVKTLSLPVQNAVTKIKKQPRIDMHFGIIVITLEFKMHENDEKMTNMNGFPVDVKVTYRNFENRGFSKKISTWTNQGKTVGEWIQHLWPINHPEFCYITDFYVREIELDVQTLWKTFPKLGSISIIFPQAEANENDILSAQNVLKAFLPDVKHIRFEHAPFQENFSVQHIGMGNLDTLHLQYPRNLKVDDLLTLNAERFFMHTDPMSLRDLNRFCKLWKKGSNPKLEKLIIYWRTETIPDWNVLLKGLKAKTKRNSRKKKLTIRNCRGVCGEIRYMTDQKFPFLRLPDDISSMVLESMDHYDKIAYSFLSKKAYSMIKDLHLPILHVMITMKKQPEIEVKLSSISIKFELNMLENNENMTDLNGFPVDVRVTYRNHENRGFSEKISTWTNQGKSVGEWVQHLCSISQPEVYIVAEFYVREIELDIQTLRNTFLKLKSFIIIFPQTEQNKHDILSARNVLKAFQPDVKHIRLKRPFFQDHFSLQHIGMGNLKWLCIKSPHNLNVNDLLTLNAEIISLDTDQMSLRDLNRFFKLWKKGSNPKLRELTIFWATNILPDWNVLLKGLEAETARNSRGKKLNIRNCRGVCGEIRYMTDQRFPFLRLPDDISSMVLESIHHYEKIAYSFLSKKAYSMIKALHLPILNVMITMKKQPEIEVKLSSISIKFELNMHENDEKMTHLNGVPVDVRVTYLNFENHEFSKKISTWTNQGKTVGEWIQHLFSINQPEYCYVTDFYAREIELDVQTLRNTFPKLGSITIIFPEEEEVFPEEEEL